MESLYLETNALIQQIYPGLSSLEKASTSQQLISLERDVKINLETITRNCERLDVLASKEGPVRRRTAIEKNKQLKYDCQHLKAAFERLLHKQSEKLRFETDRAELLRRVTPNDMSPNDSTSVYLGDAALQHNSRMNNTNRQIDQLIDHGGSVLDNLRNQGASLKGIRRKILDVAQTLGLSNTVMRLIEQRTAEDKKYLFGGMVVTMLIMYVLYQIIKGGATYA